MKQAGKRSAGKLHAAFDVAGAGNVAMGELWTHRAIERARLETLHLQCARQFSTLPARGRWVTSVPTVAVAKVVRVKEKETRGTQHCYR